MPRRECTREGSLSPALTVDRMSDQSDTFAPLLLIAGGGIGGLAAALLLSERGWRVRILEKRHLDSEEGAGIQIGPNGSRVLCDLGLGTALADQICEPDGIDVWDGVAGHRLTTLPLGRWLAQRHGAPYWVLHRADLHSALLKRAQQNERIEITDAAAVENVAESPGGVAVSLRTGETLNAEALIAADGLWSQIRRKQFDAAEPVFIGKCAARAVIPAAHMPREIAANRTNVWLRPGTHVVHYPVRAGREIAIVVIFEAAEAGPGWAADLERERLLTLAAQFPSPLRELLAQPVAWRQWSLHACRPLRRWSTQRVALLGDAAHPILPFLAQGGVMALEDAYVLAQELQPDPERDIGASLARYAQRRRPRVERVMAASARNGKIYHLSGPARWVRNRVLAQTPARRLMAGYDWLYGWRA